MSKSLHSTFVELVEHEVIGQRNEFFTYSTQLRGESEEGSETGVTVLPWARMRFGKDIRMAWGNVDNSKTNRNTVTVDAYAGNVGEGMVGVEEGDSTMVVGVVGADVGVIKEILGNSQGI